VLGAGASDGLLIVVAAGVALVCTAAAHGLSLRRRD
jgi:hypothetical protein